MFSNYTKGKMAVGRVFPKLRYKVGRVLYSTLGAILNYFEEPLEAPVVRCNDECPKTPFKGVQVVEGESVKVFVVDNGEGGKRTETYDQKQNRNVRVWSQTVPGGRPTNIVVAADEQTAKSVKG